MKHLEMVPYDPSWPGAFAAERDRIAAVLGDRALRIDHNGSTSVPGLAAKPVIDIQVSVRSLQPLAEYTAPLAQLGYVHVPHQDDSFCPFFHRPAAWPHTHHVHLVESGSTEERRTLAFRDYLREHSEVAREYEALKRRLAPLYDAATFDSRQAYADAKTEFVTRITERALAEGLPVQARRAVPWNMPFYRRLGFEEIAHHELRPEFVAVVADEAARDLDPRARTVMRYRCMPLDQRRSLEPIARDTITGRELYVLELPNARSALLGAPGTRFGCFLVMDASGVNEAIIRSLARRLLVAGAVYFATWGPDCERVHDLIDAERPREEPREADVIMTTWHEGVDLDEAIWQAVFVAMPAGRYADGCDAVVAVVVDDPPAASRIRHRYADLEGLRRDVEGRD